MKHSNRTALYILPLLYGLSAAANNTAALSVVSTPFGSTPYFASADEMVKPGAAMRVEIPEKAGYELRNSGSVAADDDWWQCKVNPWACPYPPDPLPPGCGVLLPPCPKAMTTSEIKHPAYHTHQIETIKFLN